MKPWTSWLAPVGMAASCLFWVGCGGSTPSDADSQTATDTGVATSGPAASTPTLEPMAPAPEADATAPTATTAGDQSAPKTAEETPAPKADSSSTNELLALSGGTPSNPADASAPSSTSPSAPSPTPAAPANSTANTLPAPTLAAPGNSSSTNPLAAPTLAAPGNSSSTNPLAGSNLAAPGNSSSKNPLAAPTLAAPGNSSSTNPLAGSNLAAPGNSAATNASMTMPGSSTTAPGGAGDANAIQPADQNEPGMDGAPLGPGGKFSEGNFRNPMTSAAAFLKALQAKNPDMLAQATALRAPTEASPKYQKVFTAILEQSLAPEDLDELAKKLAGYKIIGNNVPKSTGRFEVIVGKMQGTSQFHRTITMRKEKAGWKVVDISGAREFEKPIMMPRMGGTGRTGGRR